MFPSIEKIFIYFRDQSDLYYILKIGTKVLSVITTFLLLKSVAKIGLLWEFNIALTFAVVDINLRYAFSKKTDIESSGKIAGIIFLLIAVLSALILWYFELVSIAAFVVFILSNLALQNLEFTTSSPRKLFVYSLIRFIDILILSLSLIDEVLLWTFIFYRLFLLALTGIKNFPKIRILQQISIRDLSVSYYSVFHFSIMSFPLYFLLKSDDGFWAYRVIISAIIGFIPSMLVGVFTDKLVLVKPIISLRQIRRLCFYLASITLGAFCIVALIDNLNIYDVGISLYQTFNLILFYSLVAANDIVNIVWNNSSIEQSNTYVPEMIVVCSFFILSFFFWSGFNEWRYLILATISFLFLLLIKLRKLEWRL